MTRHTTYPRRRRLLIGTAIALFGELLAPASEAPAAGRLTHDGATRLWVADEAAATAIEGDSLFPPLLLKGGLGGGGLSADLLVGYGWEAMIRSGELRKSAAASPLVGSRFVYRQFYAGLLVVGGRLVVRKGPAGRVIWAHSSLARWRARPSPAFRLDALRAARIARSAAPYGEVLKESAAESVVLSVDGVPRFCYRVLLTTRRPAGAWEVIVDAADGTLLALADRLQRLDGRGMVFDPDPKSALGDSTLQDEDDAAEAIPQEAYREVVLPDLAPDDDSLFVLTGPWADTSPTENRARLESPDFLFDREDDRFEEVMAYYHIDRQARYVRRLGFDDITPSPQLLWVNGIGDDVSFFNPFDETIVTGSGGVDDAEDADVLLHEYGHALIWRIIPEWQGGETGLLAEGLCDYLAGDGSLRIAPDYRPMEVYNWDGHNEFWAGRALDADYHYPEDAGRESHDAGQLWSATLTEIRQQDGQERDDWNRVVLDHLFSLADSATVPDAAEALLLSDRELTGGRFRGVILNACERRGILSPEAHRPHIVHKPLRDSEDVNAARPVVARITSDLPLDTSWTLLVFRFGDEDPDSLRLSADENDPNLYLCEIPAPGRETDAAYYILATDSSGRFTTDPPGAPATEHHFYIGPDRFAPVIAALDSIPDTVFPEGDIVVGATVTDNVGVAEVRLLWFDNQMNAQGDLELEEAEVFSGLYTGRMLWRAGRDEAVFYRLRATDAAARPNVIESPLQSFTVGSEAVVDDFESGSRRWRLTGWERSNLSSYGGEWSLRDRAEGDTATPREALAELDETWRLGGLGRARLILAERHRFDRGVMETGVIEVVEEGSDEWQELLTVAGSQLQWLVREVNLDRFAAQGAAPIRVRLRTDTPADASPDLGWLVDDIRLRVGNIVTADEEASLGIAEFSLGEPFPNPTNGAIRLLVAAPRAGEVRLLDVAGRRALALPISSGSRVVGIDLATLPAGVYWVRMEGAAGSRRVILVK